MLEADKAAETGPAGPLPPARGGDEMTLANIWFFLVALLLTVYVILDGFDLGAGVLYPFLGRTEDEKSVIRASIGPVWDGNEVWLLTGAGAIFAAFPMVYAMTFSGFYLAIMLVLFGLILRAVSLEFRHRDASWKRVWDGAFFLGSLVPSLLVGVALGNVIRGVPMDAQGNYIGTFLDLLNPYSLLVGVTGLFLLVQHGAAWLAVKSEGALHDRAGAGARCSSWSLRRARRRDVAGDHPHRLARLGQRVRHGRSAGCSWSSSSPALLYTIWQLRKDGGELRSFLGSAVIIIGLAGIAAVGNFPDMVPARGTPPATSLTVERAASGDLTLKVMLILALIVVPIVLVYTALVYRTFWGKTKAAEAEY